MWGSVEISKLLICWWVIWLHQIGEYYCAIVQIMADITLFKNVHQVTWRILHWSVGLPPSLPFLTNLHDLLFWQILCTTSLGFNWRTCFMRHWQTGFLQFWRQDNHLGLDHENTAAVTLSEGYNIVLWQRNTYDILIYEPTIEYMIHKVYMQQDIHFVLNHENTAAVTLSEWYNSVL